MAAGVIDRDMGYSRLLRLVRLPQPHVAVGIQGEDATKTIKDENGEILQVVLAGVHEFGREDGSIPERSYIRATVDANRSKYRQLQKRLIGLVVEGKLTPERALKIIGERVVADMRRTMDAGLKPDLAESTKKRRRTGDGPGGYKPLIDTGQLKNSITYAVRER